MVMSKNNNDKTNVCRLLDTKKIPYTEHAFPPEAAVSAEEVASLLKEDPQRVFKTLVTVGKSGHFYVFVVPGPEELDLKKAAAAVGEKSIEMLKQKDLLPLTGYIHGGCSPIGMKKFFRTTIHASAADYDSIFISAGRRGRQVEISTENLAKIIRFELKDLIKS